VATHLAHGDHLAACGTDVSCPPAAAAAFASTSITVNPLAGKENQMLLSNQFMDSDLEKETTLKVYPNPFNESASIEFTSKSNGWTTVRLFDHLGREVSILYEGDVEPGVSHKLVLDRTGLVPGIYLCALQVGDAVITQTILFSR
jgi:hypothetical protein